jgi:hypothetical protein
VLDAAVVATRDADGNESPRAYIVAKDSETAKNPSFPQDVEVWVRSKVGDYHCRLEGEYCAYLAIPTGEPSQAIERRSQGSGSDSKEVSCIIGSSMGI